MNDALFSSVDLEAQDSGSGYRLHHIELYNWGTFDKRTWRMTLDGNTSLLTGDIGSGKSTLVDAITTLLMPSHRIAYNKAAGAESRERTLRSYVEGYYKSERIESSGRTRSVGLRDHRSYSVVLGVFRNEGYDETVTLAQVFHQRERQAGQPDRFFAASDKELSIDADFADFGSDLNQLRRRLRNAGARVETTFTQYGRIARRLLGIASEQAMELFHQTVSMKSVGNLNDFVRNHMLEPVDATEKITSIVNHFDDLSKAYEAIQRAKDQLESLTGLVVNCDKHEAVTAELADTERQRDAARMFFSELKIELLEADIAHRERQISTGNAEAEQLEIRAEQLAAEREQLIADRASSGGNRLSTLEQTIAYAREQEEQRRRSHTQYEKYREAAGFGPVSDAADFAQTRADTAARINETDSRLDELDEQYAASASNRGRLNDDSEQLRQELDSLASRRSNIPRQVLAVRAQLCDELGLGYDDLPFAGELIDVSADHGQWRGAAERVLRGFAISMLVPQGHYRQVSTWVNQRSLKGTKLVYHRVPEAQAPHTAAAQNQEELLLRDTLEVQPGTFATFLNHELARRANHVCAQSLEHFHNLDRAVTREGQIRSGQRHEKDDRYRADDPSRWVLGWSNEQKVNALAEQLSTIQSQLLDIGQQMADLKAERDQLHVRRNSLTALADYSDFRDIDWQLAAQQASEAEAERQQLLADSSQLSAIERRLDQNQDTASGVDQQLSQLRARIAVDRDAAQNAARKRDREREFVNSQLGESDYDAIRQSYENIEQRLGDDRPADPDACDRYASELTTQLQKSIDTLHKRAEEYAVAITRQMDDIRRHWPEATTDMDSSLESVAEFRQFRDRVADDDLPRFEDEFKHQLNTNTIRELATFNNWLRRQADEITQRVARINEALGAIDYSPGRYITLVAERSPDEQIRQFTADLRGATDDALGVGDHYSEQRFMDVKTLVERFRGREGHTEADKSWLRKVTDVRNWYTFSASELEHGTDEPWEHYNDSDGKSGGQKEKLAYTILAASLAYQFGLAWGAQRSRDFRFAVIDEAFGRGSDVSTRYALELFAKLGLQLLIITPLQKVHVIEPYVQAIGFVDNPTGSYSRLQTLTIEQYRDQRGAQ